MTVLHMDRSQFFQKVVQSAGNRESIDFLTCTSGKEAFAYLARKDVDLILTARELEDGPVDNVLKKLTASQYSHIPVILITSSDSFEIRERYFNLGAVDFISKDGFSVKKFREQLEYYQQQDQIIINIRKKRIAILDDSRFSLNVIWSILKMYGIENVTLYSDPRKLLESDEIYDIYFIDLILPLISGESIVRELRKLHPHNIIIAISSLDKYNTIVHILESGADDYIIKPFDARLLMARLKSNFRTYMAVEEMKKMSTTDSLTGCRNHRFLMTRLEEEIERASKNRTALSLLILDIDKFKNINDDFGHPVGDLVLKSLAVLFMEKSGEKDIFGRYGGEEFLLILPDTGLNEAYEFSESMRILFENLEIENVNRPVTFSGGLAVWNGQPYDEFLKQADVLLYKAKEEGRNRIISVL